MTPTKVTPHSSSYLFIHLLIYLLLIHFNECSHLVTMQGQFVFCLFIFLVFFFTWDYNVKRKENEIEKRKSIYVSMLRQTSYEIELIVPLAVKYFNIVSLDFLACPWLWLTIFRRLFDQIIYLQCACEMWDERAGRKVFGGGRNGRDSRIFRRHDRNHNI